MWCAEESGCTDDSGRGIPFKACQLKREPMQAWGLPSASMAHSMKVANSYSGYIKRERDTALPLRRGHELHASNALTSTPHSMQPCVLTGTSGNE